jgi:cell division protein FtsB
VRKTTVAALVVPAAAAVFAFGEEYSTLDWLEPRRQERRQTIARLEVEVDSLAMPNGSDDRRLQERIAREDFGMIRKGEFLYRLETDSLDGQ